MALAFLVQSELLSDTSVSMDGNPESMRPFSCRVVTGLQALALLVSFSPVKTRSPPLLTSVPVPETLPGIH